MRYVSFCALTCKVVSMPVFLTDRCVNGTCIGHTFPSCMYCRPSFTPASPLGCMKIGIGWTFPVARIRLNRSTYHLPSRFVPLKKEMNHTQKDRSHQSYTSKEIREYAESDFNCRTGSEALVRKDDSDLSTIVSNCASDLCRRLAL
jgi:hypothetical protein